MQRDLTPLKQRKRPQTESLWPGVERAGSRCKWRSIVQARSLFCWTKCVCVFLHVLRVPLALYLKNYLFIVRPGFYVWP